MSKAQLLILSRALRILAEPWRYGDHAYRLALFTVKTLHAHLGKILVGAMTPPQ